MFHGYTATKSQLLAEAGAFREMGFNVLLVDMSGHGGSEGNVTTFGYNEAADVLAAYRFAKTLDNTIILYGVSMGAAAILRAVAVYDLQPQALLLECPFGNMVQAVRNRFRLMHLPDFPLAEMLVFWGGVQNDYPAFSHNPSEYAREVKVPTLLMYGLRDQRVIKPEVKEIYRNLPEPKEVVYFEELAHESYLKKQPRHWKAAINDFLLHTKEINHDL
jgi:alpha-beta hydrolase superfamily lysophospholipase